jgi:antitoxin CptB
MDMGRLRWRARRGLLENDLLLTRFLDRHQHLDAVLLDGLHKLLALGDNELLDLLLARSEPEGELDCAEVRTVLAELRRA